MVHSGTHGGRCFHGNGKYQPEHEKHAAERKQCGTAMIPVQVAARGCAYKRAEKLNTAIDAYGRALGADRRNLGNERGQALLPAG